MGMAEVNGLSRNAHDINEGYHLMKLTFLKVKRSISRISSTHFFYSLSNHYCSY